MCHKELPASVLCTCALPGEAGGELAVTWRPGGLREEEGKAYRSHRNPRIGAAAETPPQSYGQCVTPG